MKQEKGEGYISNKYLRELVVKFNKMNINDTGEWCDAYERKLENKNNKKSITEDALSLLGIKAFSTALFRKKLLARGYGKKETEEVILLFTEKGYLNDLLYGETLCRSLRESARGTLWIRRKLKLAGLEEELIAKILENEAENASLPSPFLMEESEAEKGSIEEEAASRALQAKWRSLAKECDPRKKREKALRFLAGRGFSSASSYAALRKQLAGEGEGKSPFEVEIE